MMILKIKYVEAFIPGARQQISFFLNSDTRVNLTT